MLMKRCLLYKLLRNIEIYGKKGKRRILRRMSFLRLPILSLTNTTKIILRLKTNKKLRKSSRKASSLKMPAKMTKERMR
jgi:hypothetical protein